MKYERYSRKRFYAEVTSDEHARAILWRAKCGGSDFKCPDCSSCEFNQYRTRPEVRQCRRCGKQVRLRARTIMDQSKVGALAWTRAIFHMMEGRRGVSALELQEHLGISSKETVWMMLHKIREALSQRESKYKLSGVIELDGAKFGRKETGNQIEALVAVESCDYTTKSGKAKTRAGFIKIEVTPEKKASIQAFVDKSVETGTWANTDGAPEYRNIKGLEQDYRVVSGDAELIQAWLPTVHKAIGNARTSAHNAPPRIAVLQTTYQLTSPKKLLRPMKACKGSAIKAEPKLASTPSALFGMQLAGFNPIAHSPFGNAEPVCDAVN